MGDADVQPVLELEHVSRVYGDGDAAVTALHDVSLRVMPGDFLSIMGPSGSGKSTMLGLLGCLDLPTTGTIRVGGHEVTATSAATSVAMATDTPARSSPHRWVAATSSTWRPPPASRRGANDWTMP